MPRTSFMTISYAPDFERCKRLCESFDSFVKGYEHHLICPKSDLHLFEKLAAPHRKISTYQDILPRRYWKIPFTKKWWLDPSFFPVRGWILQQLLKIASAAKAYSEDVYFLDSDLYFFKPFDPANLIEDGNTRLYAINKKAPSKLHAKWQSVSEQLFGLTNETFHTDYIGQIISWKVTNVQEMIHKIEEVTKKPWYIALGHTFTFSEYLLYGNFVERVLGKNNGHVVRDYALSFDIWNKEEFITAYENSIQIPTESCAILIQSNLGIDINEENALLRKLIKNLEIPSIK